MLPEWLSPWRDGRLVVPGWAAVRDWWSPPPPPPPVIIWAVREAPRPLTADAHVRGWIDSPRDGDVFPVDEPLEVRGWIFGVDGRVRWAEVEIVDEDERVVSREVIADDDYVDRPDVAAFFPDLPQASRSGFVKHLTVPREMAGRTLTLRLFGEHERVAGWHRQTRQIRFLEWDRHQDTAKRAAAVYLSAFLASQSEIVFPAVEEPDVSLVILLYNNAALSVLGLMAVLAGMDQPYEVILVDNRSTDETDELLARIRGATVIRNAENVGFGPACNQGAAVARGRHLVFLNNDLQIFPSAIRHATDLLDRDRSVGAVGGRIILLNGKLQEAGSFLWQSGWAHAYLRGEEPDHPEAMFQRDVDYCSAALLVTPRRLFEEQGGFADDFRPAYYEDTDYCVRLWRRGLRVVYHPQVCGLHYESACGTSASRRRLGDERREIFIRRHASWLATQCPSGDHSDRDIFSGRERDRGQRRVLIVDDRVPTGHDDEQAARMGRLVRGLLELGCRITLVTLERHPVDWSATWATLDARVEIVPDRGPEGLADVLRRRRERTDMILVAGRANLALVQRALSGPDADDVTPVLLLDRGQSAVPPSQTPRTDAPRADGETTTPTGPPAGPDAPADGPPTGGAPVPADAEPPSNGAIAPDVGGLLRPVHAIVTFADDDFARPPVECAAPPFVLPADDANDEGSPSSFASTLARVVGSAVRVARPPLPSSSWDTDEAVLRGVDPRGSENPS